MKYIAVKVYTVAIDGTILGTQVVEGPENEVVERIHRI